MENNSSSARSTEKREVEECMKTSLETQEEPATRIKERKSAPPEQKKKRLVKEGSFRDMTELYEKEGSKAFDGLLQSKELTKDLQIMQAMRDKNVRNSMLLNPELDNLITIQFPNENNNDLVNNSALHEALKFCEICRRCSETLTHQDGHYVTIQEESTGTTHFTNVVRLTERPASHMIIRWHSLEGVENCFNGPRNVAPNYAENEDQNSLSFNICEVCAQKREYEFSASNSSLKKRSDNDNFLHCSFTEATSCFGEVALNLYA